jgi:FAD/FMN-containing dehydrogenase
MPASGSSWGRYPHVNQHIVPLHWRGAELPMPEGSLLAYGNGRSYGDSCLNDAGNLLLTRGLDRFIAFDPGSGILRCETGVLFSEILALVLAQGWFLPVLPGTKFITVGGAIANDVHGKNHHRAGTFGEHVRQFELLRSDGSRLLCDRMQNSELFHASIGGLGLTGLIVWAEFSLQRIAGPWLASETLRFENLAEFFALSSASEQDYEYSVAWIDCCAPEAQLGRGLFMRANHAPAGNAKRPLRQRQLRMPFTPPLSLVNRATLRLFNTLYYHRPITARGLSHYEPFFFPLDSIAEWNRMYGPRGFLQYQCLVPPQNSAEVVAELLRIIARSGTGSFLAVLKTFGEREAAGLMSFARAGTTLALDFANTGAATFALLDRLDAVVATASGSVYPAKDARMSGSHFRQYFPQWEKLQTHIDPKFSSSFWRRVTE